QREEKTLAPPAHPRPTFSFSAPPPPSLHPIFSKGPLGPPDHTGDRAALLKKFTEFSGTVEAPLRHCGPTKSHAHPMKKVVFFHRMGMAFSAARHPSSRTLNSPLPLCFG